MIWFALIGYLWGTAVTLTVLRAIDGRTWMYWRNLDLKFQVEEERRKSSRAARALEREREAREARSSLEDTLRQLEKEALQVMEKTRTHR